MEAEEEGADEVGPGVGVGGVGLVVGIVQWHLVGGDGVDGGGILCCCTRLLGGIGLVVIGIAIIGIVTSIAIRLSEGPLLHHLGHPVLDELAISIGIDNHPGNHPDDRRADRPAHLPRLEADGPLPDVEEGGLAVPLPDVVAQRPQGPVALDDGGDLGVVPAEVPDQVGLVLRGVLVGMRRGLAGEHGAAAAAGRGAAAARARRRRGGRAGRASSAGHHVAALAVVLAGEVTWIPGWYLVVRDTVPTTEQSISTTYFFQAVDTKAGRSFELACFAAWQSFF